MKYPVYKKAAHIAKIFLCTIVAIGSIAGAQYLADGILKERPKPPLLLIPAPVIRATDLNLHAAIASFLWLGVIQRFSDLARERLKGLSKHIAIINGIDPRFSYPYAFGLLVLPSLRPESEVLEIGLRGLSYADPDWRIPYYLGVAYHVHYKNRTEAARFMNIAAQTPGAPANVQYVAQTYGNRQDLREQTRQIWKALYENSSDEIVKEQARAYLDHLDILDLLDKASAVHKKRTGRYPKTAQELVTSGVLKALPGSPFGLEYGINEEGKAYSKYDFLLNEASSSPEQ